MDDASGNYFGRKLLRDLYFHKIPQDLAFASPKNTILEADTIKNIYTNNLTPNTYLATFARFLIENKEHSYCKGCNHERLTAICQQLHYAV
jgi:hypothetical protein